MDDSLQTIIYIILTIAFIIYSAIRKKKPTKSNNPSVSDNDVEVQKSNPTSFMNFLEDQFSEKTHNNIQENELNYEEVLEQQKVSNIVDNGNMENKVDVVGNDKVNDNETIKETEISDESKIFKFDLKKAVIYSELLNRKNY